MDTIGIIGGGIIGTAAAAWLIADGHEVTLFERDPEGTPASGGNAGLIALSEITPLARLATLGSAPSRLLDPLGPLTVRWRDAPGLTPWLMRFAASARPHQVERATTALSTLMKTALADHQELARRGHHAGTMQRTGALYLFDTDASLRAALGEWAERRRHGIEYREIAVDEARAMVPALTGPFARSLLAPDYWTVSSPAAILAGLRARVAAAATLVPAEIVSVRPVSDGIVVVASDGKEWSLDKLVVAAGVWSRDLVGGLGLSVLLETERGYNTTFPHAPFELPLPVFPADHGFVVSPLADGLRVGGAVELASPEAPPNFARAEAILTKARRYMPAIPDSGGRQWMGCRPSTPDSLPVIGRHPGDGRIVFAFGHGHLGLTLSAVTARHVAGLLGDRPPDPLLAPFGIERFQ